MPMSTNVPRGCSRSRGAADVRHVRALGGDLAQKTNRLYMLTVRRESLINKKNSLHRRLKDIDTQLKEIEEDMRELQGIYNKVLGRRKKPLQTGGNGHGGHAISIGY